MSVTFRPPAVGLAAWRLAATGPRALDLAERVCADGVQFDLGGPGRGDWIDAPWTIGALRERSAATGVALLALTANVLNDIGLTAPPGGADARRVRRLLIRQFNAAQALGMPLVFVPSFRRSMIDGPDALRRTIAVFRWAAGEATARGLLLASENLLDARQAAELVEGVGSPVFRLLLDTYNPRVVGLDVPRLVAGVAPYLADQIHVRDGLLGTDATPALDAGDGQVAAVLEAVARHRIAVRALVLENDYRDGDTARLAADVAAARRYAETLTPRPAEAVHASWPTPAP